MLLPARRRLPVAAWLVPLVLVLLVATGAVYDYFQQHQSFVVFGSSIDSAKVQSVVIQPSDSKTSRQFYSVSGHGQIIQLLQVLSEGKSVSGNGPGGSAQPTVSLYMNLGNKQIVPIRIYTSPNDPHTVLVDASHHWYQVSATILTLINSFHKS